MAASSSDGVVHLADAHARAGARGLDEEREAEVGDADGVRRPGRGTTRARDTVTDGITGSPAASSTTLA